MSLVPFSAELPSLVVAIAGKGAVLSLSALGLAAVLRGASAATRHLVLALAVVLLLLLPPLTALLPSWNLALKTSAAVAGDVPAVKGVSLEPASVFLLLPWTISLLLLIRLGLAVHGLSRLRAGSRPASPAEQELAEEHRRRLGIGRPVRLAVSSSVTVPVTFGWRRPVVLLPEAASGWTEEALREALVHELAHVQRGDWFIQMIACAACAVHWLDPFVWLLCRRLRLEAELACDDQVLRSGVGAEGYAERLVALARQVRGSSLPPASAVAFTRLSELARRVSALLDSRRRREGPGRLARTAASAAALLLLLLLAPARLVRAESESPRVARPRVEAVRAALPKPEPSPIRERNERAAAERPKARRAAAEADAPVAAGASSPSGPSGSNPKIVEPGATAPPSPASRAYAENLGRILSGTFFEPIPPKEGC